MKIAKNQYYLFHGIVENISGYSYSYRFSTTQQIDDGEYYLILTDGILLFQAQVAVLKEEDSTYLVLAHIEDEMDEIQFETQMDYLSKRIDFTFGLESVDGVFYMPDGVTV